MVGFIVAQLIFHWEYEIFAYALHNFFNNIIISFQRSIQKYNGYLKETFFTFRLLKFLNVIVLL